MSEQPEPDTLRQLLEELGDVRVRFWTCPVREHRDRKTVTVEWIEDVAYCTEETCGNTSENVRVAFCQNYREDLDRECDGILRFGLGDIEAACSICGARCGWMVAKYVERET